MSATDALNALLGLGNVLVRLPANRVDAEAAHFPYLDLLDHDLVPQIVVEFGGRPLLYFVSEEGLKGFSYAGQTNSQPRFSEAVEKLKVRIAQRGERAYLLVSDLGRLTLRQAILRHPKADDIAQLNEITLADISRLGVEGIAPFLSYEPTKRPSDTTRTAIPFQLLHYRRRRANPSLGSSVGIVPLGLLPDFESRGLSRQVAILMVATTMLLKLRQDRKPAPLRAMGLPKERLRTQLLALRTEYVESFGGLPESISTAASDLMADVVLPIAQEGPLSFADLDFSNTLSTTLAESFGRFLGGLRQFTPVTRPPRFTVEVADLLLLGVDFPSDTRFDGPILVLDPECGTGLALITAVRRYAARSPVVIEGVARARFIGVVQDSLHLAFAEVAVTALRYELGARQNTATPIEITIVLEGSPGHTKILDELGKAPADLLIGATRVLPDQAPLRWLKANSPFAQCGPGAFFFAQNAAANAQRRQIVERLDLGGIADFSGLAGTFFTPDRQPLLALIGLNRLPPEIDRPIWFNPTPLLYDRAQRLAFADDARAQPLALATLLVRPWILPLKSVASSAQSRVLSILAYRPRLGPQLEAHRIAVTLGTDRLTRPIVYQPTDAGRDRDLRISLNLKKGQLVAWRSPTSAPVGFEEIRLWPSDVDGYAWLDRLQLALRDQSIEIWLRYLTGRPGYRSYTITQEDLWQIPLPDSMEAISDDGLVGFTAPIDDTELNVFDDRRRAHHALRRRTSGHEPPRPDLKHYLKALETALAEYLPDERGPFAHERILGAWTVIGIGDGKDTFTDFQLVADKIASQPDCSEQWVPRTRRRMALARQTTTGDFSEANAELDAVRYLRGRGS